MRSGSVYRRCTSCGRRVQGRRTCEHCGGEWSWAYTVDVGPRGGTRQRISRSGYEHGERFTTKAEAVAEMNRVQREKKEGTYVERSNLTVAQWLDEWLPGRKGEIRPSTYDSYEYHARLHIKPRIGDVPLQALTLDRIRALYAELEEAGGKNGRPLARKSVHNAHIALHVALDAAVDRGYLKRNPADGAHSSSQSTVDLEQVWDSEELGRWLTYVRDCGERTYALWRLLAMTGMRRGEAIGLHWRHIDLEAGTVTIDGHRAKGGGRVARRGPKTSRGRRTIDIDPLTSAALRSWRKQQAAERLAAAHYEDTTLVFTLPDGRPLDPDGTSSRFRRLVKESGVRPIRPHDLRHTAATLLLRQGVSPHVVSRMLGHASVAFTLDVYSHVLPGQQADAVAKLAEAVDGP